MMASGANGDSSIATAPAPPYVYVQRGRLADIPTQEGRIAEMQRRYDQFIAEEDQC